MTTERSAPADPTIDSNAAAPRVSQQAPAMTPRVVTSDSLLAGDSQLAIVHNQAVYFLRKTRFGKLILTK
jgi:hemin uptake protein HemP